MSDLARTRFYQFDELVIDGERVKAPRDGVFVKNELSYQVVNSAETKERLDEYLPKNMHLVHERYKDGPETEKEKELDTVMSSCQLSPTQASTWGNSEWRTVE